MSDRPIAYLLDGQGNPYPSDDSHAINELLKNITQCRLGLTVRRLAGHEITISTIFTVLDDEYIRTLKEDCPVRLYETQIFLQQDLSIQAVWKDGRRYGTREQAIAGHREIIEEVEELLLQARDHSLFLREFRDMLR